MSFKKTALDLAKEIFSDSSKEELNLIIWNMTGYPSFFKGDPIIEFERQLKEAKALIAWATYF